MQVAVKSISYREANPGKFNNRVRNKMYYTQVAPSSNQTKTLTTGRGCGSFEGKVEKAQRVSASCDSNDMQSGPTFQRQVRDNWMRWSGHNFKAEGTQGAVFWTFHKRFLLMKIPNSLTSFVLVPRCTQCFFWTFPALDLALDPGTRLKEFRRWTMGSSRFGNKTQGK